MPDRAVGWLGVHQHGCVTPSRSRTSSTRSLNGWTASSWRTCGSPGTSRSSSPPTGRRPSTPSSRAGTCPAPIRSSFVPTRARRRRPSPSASSTGRPSMSCSASTGGMPTYSDTVLTATRPTSAPPTAPIPGIHRNVEYSLRELRALYLQSDLAAAAESVDDRRGRRPDGQWHLPATEEDHARASGIDYPDLSDDQLKGAMYDWHVFPNTVFLIDMGCCLTYRSRPNGLTRTAASSMSRVSSSHLARGCPPPRRNSSTIGGRAMWERSSARTSPICPR